MRWLFNQCPDLYGLCIRQYVLFGLSLFVLFLALYSVFKVYRQAKRLIFELLPLIINTTTALGLVGIYFQIQVLNIRIILLIIEIYSYFILSYGFIYMVTKKKIGAIRQIKIVKLIFFIFTITCIGALIGTIFFSIFSILSCEQDQGIGSIVLIGLHIPLLLVTWIYSRKSKAIIKEQQSYSSQLQKNTLINQEYQQKKVKLLQLKLIIFSIFLSFALHVIQLVFYYLVNDQEPQACSNNQIVVSGPLILSILSIQSFSQIFPHIMIPIIFWYLPSRYLDQAISVYMNDPNPHRLIEDSPYQKLLNMQQSTRPLGYDVRGEQQFRTKIRLMSPKRNLQRSQTI